MKKLYLLGLLFWFVCSSSDICDSKPPFCTGRVDGIYANPYNSSTFYICVNQFTYLRHCEPGLVFYDNCKCCNWPGSEQKPHVIIETCFCSDGTIGQRNDCSMEVENTVVCTEMSPCYQDGRLCR